MSHPLNTCPACGRTVTKRQSDFQVARGILRTHANRHGLTVEQALRGRKPAAVCARRATYRDLRGCGWSYHRIAAPFGKDHSTIIHALREAPDAGGS